MFFINVIKIQLIALLFIFVFTQLVQIYYYQFITSKSSYSYFYQITKEERSYIYSAAFRPAQSELSIIQVNDANILQETKLQNSDIEYLKNALQSVYPTQVSIQNSIFILLTPKFIKAENKVISFLITQMKNNANCNITDSNIIKSLAYEIEIKVVHRETQKMLNENNYSLLRQDWSNCIQDLQLYQIEEEKQQEDLYDYISKNNWNITKNKQLTTNDQEQQAVKDFIKEQTKINQDNNNCQVFAIELINPEKLDLLGIYDICINFRGCPIVQSSVQVIPTLNFNAENVNKLNKPKLSQQQILQKFKIKDENIITYQSNGQHMVEMNQLQQLNDFSYHQIQPSQLPLKKSTIIEQYDEEFSVTSDDQALPSNQATQKREIQVESDINEFIRKLFGNNQRDDLTTIEIQSSKGSKTIVDSTDDSLQINGKQAITRFNDQNITQNQIRIFSLNIITGSCIIYFDKNSAMQNSLSNPDNGIHVFSDCITFSSNIQYFQVKFVQSKDYIDVYCNNQFLGNYKYENLFIKFCVKGTEVKLY